MVGDLVAGIDVGGTFTDILLFDATDGRSFAWKVPTTPDDPSRAVANGIVEACRAAGVDADRVRRVHHGTTIATNAMLEHRGDPAGFITTAGFRDVLHIGRHQRPLNYSILQDIPWQARPLVRRRDRFTVAERVVPPFGAVEMHLDEAAVREAARTLRARGIESVVIGFLFSYLNPVHEMRAREIVLEEMPDAFVTLSHEISGQFREFERFTSAAINGFIGPKVRGYVSRLGQQLASAGLTAELRIMTSSGSVASAERIAGRPILTLLSGPAAGVIGGTAIGVAAERRNLITFDVGGTSADIGIVVDGEIREAGARDMSIAGFPVQLPMIDIETIGAGGGSIAYRDAGGGFRVGPRSAGARPGPAAYGHGGTAPTVTDAHVVLGRLDPERFLGGRMRLDVAAAERTIQGLATELGSGLREAAAGILRIVNANMAEAIRSRTIRRGLDPRDFALVAFGGAGPLHAVEVAALLDIPEVIVPPYPGLTSAAGLVGTNMRYDHVRSVFLRDDRPDGARLQAQLGELRARIETDFARDGVGPESVEFQFFADMRYLGQGYELRVALNPTKVGDTILADGRVAFEAAHRRDYGRDFPDRVTEIVNVCVVGVRRSGGRGFVSAPAEQSGVAQVAHATCTFTMPGGAISARTPFVLRARLRDGDTVPGPAVILQDDTTVVVPPGALARCLPSKSILITLPKTVST
jgi:N-methylhydantoinase A/oxoprolinase/acetone carboxylase beta subunit